jgi:addiction module RelB/DinJ family antitoxin
MASVSVNIRMDKTVKQEAEKLFGEFGMSMSTAINVFVKQAVRQQKIPFEISVDNSASTKAVRPPFPSGSMEGKMWIADDFDAPLDDMKEYME